MASITRNHLYKVDLNKPLTRQSCGILLAEGDNKGDCFTFTLLRDGEALVLDGTTVVTAYFIRQDGNTVPCTGTYASNKASVTLPESCYVQEGYFALAVKVNMSDVTATIAVLDGFIKRTTTDAVVDPGEVVPSLEDLLAMVAEVERIIEAGSALNLVNGSASGSLRHINSAAEDDSYTIGIRATALGFQCKATGTSARAEGVMSTAAGMGAVADGLACEANGAFSRAYGGSTVADGENSAAMGTYTHAHGKDQLVIGRQNIHDESGQHAFIVGNGDEATTGEDYRSNAFAVDWNGNGWFQGNVFVEGNANGRGEVLAKQSETAPAIIPTATGKIITVSDSAQRPFAGLRVYGKTTQDGTPTPDSPVPLVNVGSDGTVKVTATGKNLLPPYASSASGFFTANEDGTVTASGYTQYQVNLVSRVQLPPGVYTLSGCPAGGSRANEPGAYAMYVLLDDGYHFDTGSGVTFALTTAQEVSANIIVRADTTMSGQVFRPQIEIGSAATAFEPYKDGGSASFSTPNGLPGIPVSSGGNYTDENGQQWICDEIHWPDYTYVQRVVRLTDFTKQNSLEATDIYVAPAGNTLRGKSENIGLCNVTNSYGYNEFDNTHFYVSATTCVVYVPKGFSGSIEALVALAEPIETAPELYTYNNLIAQYPNTTILNDGGVGMAVDYVADTKTYIDQRIASLLSSN